MILYDPALNMNFHDYGIMLPIAPDRGKQVLEYMNNNYFLDARGGEIPYPGPVMDSADALKFLGICDTAENSGIKTAYGTVISREDLERVHSKGFIDSLYNTGSNSLEEALLVTYELIDERGNPNRYEKEKATKPLNDLFQTILAQVGGTYLSCRLALSHGPGFCFFMGGGMHHARYDSGSGFCLLNDSAIAITKILFEWDKIFPQGNPHSIKSNSPLLMWIIDMDAHKGDGTAELIHFARQRGELSSLNYKNEGKPCVLTLSIHMAQGWPLDKESLLTAKNDRAPLISSDIDIGIEAGEEKLYTSKLAESIKELEQLSSKVFPGRKKPDFVLVVDGADTYEHDELPSTCLLKLSLEQCCERDNFVYRYLMDQEIPSAWIMAGGYGSRAFEPPAYFLRNLR